MVEKVDESIYDDPPEGFQDWPILDRIEWSMESMRTRLTVGANARRRLAKVIRNQRIGAIITVLIAGVLFAFAYYNINENKENAVTTCESGNNRLQGSRADAQQEYNESDASAAIQGFAEDGAVRMYYRAKLDWKLNELYPFRDCKNLNKEIKVPSPPPSFNKALIEACEENNLQTCRDVVEESKDNE